MLTTNETLKLNLQLFADGGSAGGDGGTAEGKAADSMLATSTKGVKNPLADVKYGIQEEAQTTDVQEATKEDREVDRNAEFAKLRTEYKEEFDAWAQETIRKRMKGTKETVEKYNAILPALEMFAKKYGVDASDVSAIAKAIEEDDSYYEQEAMEKGISVETLKSIRKMERESDSLKRQMQEMRNQEAQKNAERIYAGWMEQAKNVKSIYKSFDINAEMQNKTFVDLLRSNIDVQTAYEVVHKDEIMPAAMQFTAKKVEQQLTDKIIARGNRPTENGINSQSSAVVKSDVSQLSKYDRAEIIRRVAQGETIRF